MRLVTLYHYRSLKRGEHRCYANDGHDRLPAWPLLTGRISVLHWERLRFFLYPLTTLTDGFRFASFSVSTPSTGNDAFDSENEMKMKRDGDVGLIGI